MKGLFLIYGIAGVGTLAALYSPAIGLFIYVGFAVLRPEGLWGWAGDLTGISLVVGIATLIGWLIRGFGTRQFGPGRMIVLALMAFFVWSMLSAANAQDKQAAYDSIITMAKFVMPFLIGVTLLDSEPQARKLMWIIVIAQGYVGFEMNLDYWRGYNLAGDGFAGMDNNCFGVSLVSTLGPALALALISRKWWEKVLSLTAAALILHTTLLTYSRGAMLGLIVVGATAFVLMPKRPKYLLALAVTALITVRFVGPQLRDRYATAFAAEEELDGSSQSRLSLWRDCFKLALNQPAFGVGPANFPIVAPTLGWEEGKEAHSVWMQTLAEVGFPGVVLLFVFFAWTVVKLWPLARQKLTDESRYRVAIASGVVMSIAGFMVAGQFVSLAGLETPYYMAMIGVVLLKQTPKAQELAPAIRPAARLTIAMQPRFSMRMGSSIASPLTRGPIS